MPEHVRQGPSGINAGYCQSKLQRERLARIPVAFVLGFISLVSSAIADGTGKAPEGAAHRVANYRYSGV